MIKIYAISESEFMFGSYLKDTITDFLNYDSILLKELIIDGNDTYNFGDDEKIMKATVMFTPLKELSGNVLKIDGKEETVDLKFSVTSKGRSKLYKKYLIKRL